MLALLRSWNDTRLESVILGGTEKHINIIVYKLYFDVYFSINIIVYTLYFDVYFSINIIVYKLYFDVYFSIGESEAENNGGEL